MRIGIEPPGKRQAELDESAKGLDGTLRSNHRAPARACTANQCGCAAEDGATGSSQRTAIRSHVRPGYRSQIGWVGEIRADLAAEVEAQVASAIRARH